MTKQQILNKWNITAQEGFIFTALHSKLNDIKYEGGDNVEKNEALRLFIADFDSLIKHFKG
jgi:hypothetical protein